ncbi:hypothetical protein Golax_025408, partial [Gossypium laxum]|nr:hypothetical protein [Gossypium laxum]
MLCSTINPSNLNLTSKDW